MPNTNKPHNAPSACTANADSIAAQPECDAPAMVSGSQPSRLALGNDSLKSEPGSEAHAKSKPKLGSDVYVSVAATEANSYVTEDVETALAGETQESDPLLEVDAAPSFSGMPSAPTEEQMREGEAPPRFAALRHRNFRLFWFGNLLSLFGTLAQGTAQGWLVRQLTSEPQIITAVAACNSLPISFLTLYAGVIADRIDKRRGLLVTNALSAVLAFALGLLEYLQVVQVWHVAVLALLLGTVNAFDIPIRQSFNVEMVGREDLPNAIALNSTAFNSARVVGPALGGILMGTVGIAGCFFLNALSFVALIVGLLMQRLPPHVPQDKKSNLADLPEGFYFVSRHPTLRIVTILVGFVSLAAMSFATLLPVFAKDVFHTNEHGFSTLMTCNGAGALGAAFSLALTGKMRHRGKRLLLGAFLYCLSVIAFATAPYLSLGCFFLVIAGWFLLTFLMTANTIVQTLAPDNLRGRVFSLYSLALIGTTPLGALIVGALAKAWGPRPAVQFGAGVAAVFVLGVYLRCHSLWKES